MDQIYTHLLLVALCTVLFWLRRKGERLYGPLPPSPRADPLIGNLRAMANIVDEPRAYRDWGLELGSRYNIVVVGCVIDVYSLIR
jgi:hypothetical protein